MTAKIMSWYEYLDTFIDILRDAYEVELSKMGVDYGVFKEIKSFTKWFAFPEPCQVTIFEFSSVNRVLWVVNFDENESDKKFNIIEGIKEPPNVFIKTHKKYACYVDELHFVANLDRYKYSLSWWPSSDTIPFILFGPERFSLLFLTNPREKIHPRDLALQFFYDRQIHVLKSVQSFLIKKSASQILNTVKELRKTEKSKTLQKAEKTLETALEKLKKIDEHEEKLVSIESELTGIRRLVGTKTFGEWKALISELDKINARVDALSEIKEAYEKVLNHQTELLKQQLSFLTWIKYATILVPIAVLLVPVIDTLIRYFLGII